MKTFAVLLKLLTLLLFLRDNVCAQNYRLVKNVVPSSYDIYVKPYLLASDGSKQFTFEGRVNITVRALEDGIREITVHKDYIEIEAVRLYDSTLSKLIETIDVARLTYESATDKLTVPLQNDLDQNIDYVLSFQYSGQIRNGMAGVFRVNSTDAQGNAHWILVTQMQRIDARTAFPCFDEPAFKATFKMQISRSKEMSSIFNTQLLNSVSESNDRYLDSFAETPRMSTYLVAFMVTDFKSRGSEDYAVLTRADLFDYTEFSYQVGILTIDALGEYTHIPYKELGNQVMQMAGSSKFPHNGMENWGLIIYSDGVLVNEPYYSDGWSNKEYTITILVHEISHSWFGNSVTFEWWSYFWLNEAFARYYQYYLAHEMFPEYDLDLQFVVNQVHLIFGTDATNSSQPMTSPEQSISTPSQVASKFSSITYAKGAAIVRMIRNIMGYENFDEAIRAYLKENRLQNVEPEDLFVHLQNYWPEEPYVNLNQFFYDWTQQVGYPMLIANLSLNGRLATLRQKRFLLDASDGSDDSLGYTIPLTYASDVENNFHNLTPQAYFHKTNYAFLLSLSSPVNWIVFNLQQSNYYRVFYDAPLLWAIHKALLQTPDHSGIHVANRAQIVDDLLNYARIDLLDYEEVFKFLEYLSLETHYLPWYAAFSGMQRVAQRVQQGQQHENFAAYLHDIADKAYKELDFANAPNNALDVYRRNRVVTWLCKYDHADCIRKNQLLYNTYGRNISIDFRETVFCTSNRADASAKTLQQLQQWYLSESHSSEQELLIRAMGCTRNFIDVQYRFILDEQVATASKSSALSSLYTQTPYNAETLFDLISADVDALQRALDSWSATATFISNLANYFTSPQAKGDLEAFILEEGHKFGSSVSTLEKAVETVEANLQWSQTRLSKMFNYLSVRNVSSSVVASISLVFIVLMVTIGLN